MAGRASNRMSVGPGMAYNFDDIEFDDHVDDTAGGGGAGRPGAGSAAIARRAIDPRAPNRNSARQPLAFDFGVEAADELEDLNATFPGATKDMHDLANDLPPSSPKTSRRSSKQVEPNRGAVSAGNARASEADANPPSEVHQRADSFRALLVPSDGVGGAGGLAAGGKRDLLRDRDERRARRAARRGIKDDHFRSSASASVDADPGAAAGNGDGAPKARKKAARLPFLEASDSGVDHVRNYMRGDGSHTPRGGTSIPPVVFAPTDGGGNNASNASGQLSSTESEPAGTGINRGEPGGAEVPSPRKTRIRFSESVTAAPQRAASNSSARLGQAAVQAASVQHRPRGGTGREIHLGADPGAGALPELPEITDTRQLKRFSRRRARDAARKDLGIDLAPHLPRLEEVYWGLADLPAQAWRRSQEDRAARHAARVERRAAMGIEVPADDIYY